MEESKFNLDVDNDEMPAVYQIQFMPSDLQNIYGKILKNITTDNVFNAFAEYVGENIEPLGWKAVWKPSLPDYPADSSFIVNVVDVYYQTLEASVIVIDLVYPKKSDLTEKELDKINLLLGKSSDHIVPLIDLYVISTNDNDNDFYNTANLIELVRFFYKNIWRPWDDFDENNRNEDFVNSRLLPRLSLICDIKNNILSESLINRFNAILSESFAIKSKMDLLNKKVKETESDFELKDDISDVGDLVGDEINLVSDYITEMDATEFIKLKMKLEDLEREMKIIEDHHLRSLYHTLMPEQLDEISNDNSSIHLIASNFNLNSMLNLMSNLKKLLKNDIRVDWPIKLHYSLQKAINLANSGDLIFLSSGIYNQPLSWIEKDIEIVGMNNDVHILSHKDCGDIFLFFNSPSTVKLSNLRITANHHLNNLIVVKSGHLIMNNCILDCNGSTRKAILLLPNASIDQNQCQVLNENISNHL